MSAGWDKLYVWLKANWTSLTAATSIVGYLTCSIIPGLKAYTELFAFLLANAIVWTLVELKVRIGKQPDIAAYPSMLTARSDIQLAIRKAAMRAGATRIEIFGGRIRSISDILRQFVGEVCDGGLAAENVQINVHCLAPDFLATLEAPWLREPEKFRRLYEGYGRLMSQLFRELNGHSSQPQLSRRNVKIVATHFRCYPQIYAFAIDRDEIFWGGFTWNEAKEDFEGATNPCFRVLKSNPEFDSLYAWLLNLAVFLDLTGTSHKSGDALSLTHPGSPPQGGSPDLM